MIDKAHLRDKKVAFRIQGTQGVHFGTVKHVENDGLWIDAPDLLAGAQRAYAPTHSSEQPLLARFQTPVLFVPTTALLYLIAAQE